MWLFLRKNLQLSPKKRFLTTLFIISSVAHIVLLLGLLYCTNDGSLPLTINTLQKQPPKFVLIPLAKSITSLSPKTIAPSTSIKSSPSSSRSTTSASRKQSSSLPSIKQTTVTTQSSSSVKTSLRRASKQQRSTSEEEQSPLVSKKTVPAKPSTLSSAKQPPLKKKVTAQNSNKVSTESKKNKQPALPSTKQSLPEPFLPSADHVVTPPPSNLVAERNDETINAEPLYLGHDDVEQLRLSQEVTIGIGKYWQRPAGVASTITCQVKVTISSQGNKHIEIVQSSGALAYDLCAKKAIVAYAFPRALWNRQLVLVM